MESKNHNNILNGYNNKYQIINNLEIISEQKATTQSYKVIVIGKTGVGKSTFVDRYAVTKTKNAKTMIKEVCFQIKDSIFDFTLWDPYLDEDKKFSVSLHFIDYTVAYVMFAIDDLDSFNQCNEWINELKNLKKDKSIIFLIGNKKDQEFNRKVTYEQAQNFAVNNELDGYFEISCFDMIETEENKNNNFNNNMKDDKKTFTNYYEENRDSCKLLLLRTASYIYTNLYIPYYKNLYAIGQNEENVPYEESTSSRNNNNNKRNNINKQNSFDCGNNVCFGCIIY